MTISMGEIIARFKSCILGFLRAKTWDPVKNGPSQNTLCHPRFLVAEGFATAIFLFDSLKEIQVIAGFGPDCILSMKTDSAVALKQMNTHTVTVRTRTAAQKLAFLRELIYQNPQIQPIYIPGPSQRADAQTKCLSGPALRKAQEYLNLRHVVTPVVSTIRVLGVDRTVADSSAYERWEGSEAKERIWKEGDSHVESVSPCRSLQESPGQTYGQKGRQESSQQALCELEPESTPLLRRLRMNVRTQDQSNIFLQDYRCVVTAIRQEDVGVDAYNKCYSLPCVCVAQVVICLGRRRVALIRGQNRKRPPRKGTPA